MPEIFVFRNKVAAHFAWAKGDSRDSPAEQLASILQLPIFSGNSFYVGAMTFGTTKGGKHSMSEAIKPWSIVKMHERLRQRYWPG
jgi:hypothetical protein